MYTQPNSNYYPVYPPLPAYDKPICPNPACNSTNIRDGLYWHSLTHNPVYKFLVNSNYNYYYFFVGIALFFLVPLLRPQSSLWEIFLISCLVVFGEAGLALSMMFWYRWRGQGTRGHVYKCRNCRYRWIVVNPEPALIPLRIKWTEQGLATARKGGKVKEIVPYLIDLSSLVGTYLNDLPYSIELAEESIQLCKQINDKRMMALCLNNLGFGLTYSNQLQRATNVLEQAMILINESNDWQNRAYIINSLSFALIYQGYFARARLLLFESLVLRRKLGTSNTESIIWDLEGLGMVALGEIQVVRAVRLCTAAAFRRQQIGIALPEAAQIGFDETIRRASTALEPNHYQQIVTETKQWEFARVLDYTLAGDTR